MTLAGEIKSGKPPGANKGERRVKRPRRITPDYLYNAGLAYLQRFPASTAHFKAVMSRKIKRSCAFHDDLDEQACLKMLGPVIEKFQNLGLLDDAAYLRGMVTSLRRRGLSSQAIRAKLSAKGIQTDKITLEIQRFDSDEYDSENGEIIAALRHARRKKLGPYQIREREAQKDLAALARAGFSYDIASKILSMDKPEADEALV